MTSRAPLTPSHRMRLAHRLVLAAGAAAAILSPAVPAQAFGTGTATVQSTTEGWYRTTPICDLPAGCPAPPPSPYAPDTLHIGVNLGREEARTVLQLDLAALPAGTKPVGGQLLLPVTDGTQDGTRLPEEAALRACAVTQPVTDADGAFEAGPTVDCDAASADAKFVAATEDTPAAFTVDLTALTRAWTVSPVPGALALVPAPDLDATANWHVALSQRDRTGDAVVPVTATIRYLSAAVDTTGEPATPPQPTAPAEPGSAGSEDRNAPPVRVGNPTPGPAAPPAPDVAPDPAPPPAVAPPQAIPTPTAMVTGYDYPAVFTLPLLFAAAAGWLSRAFTRDLAAVPVSERRRRSSRP